MAIAPFTINPLYSGVAVAYKNANFIADIILPRVPVPTQTFNYRTFTLGENMTVPDSTHVGRTSRPTRVEFTESETEATCFDYGLEDAVPQRDIDQALPGYDPMAIATEGLMDLVMLDREIRAATLLTTLANWNASYRTTLTGTNQWSDAGSNPITAVEDAKALMIMPATHFFMGYAVFTALRKHSVIVNAVRKMYAQDGLVTKDDLSNLFGVQVVVGEAWYNTAKLGQAVSLSRVWGKDAGLVHIGQGGGPRGRITFGFTAQWGSRIATTNFDPHMGLRGSHILTVGESVKELIVANSGMGYFWKSAVA